MTHIPYSAAARRIYRDIVAGYAHIQPALADRFVAAVTRAESLIAAFPQAFAAISPGHRFLQVRRFPYLIVYRVGAAGPYVVAIRHASRRPRRWHRRRPRRP